MVHGVYDVAQICLNGHVINKYARSMPQFNKKFCDECGAKTITVCQKCNAQILGKYEVPHILDLTGARFPTPAYCPKCGTPYPWTAKGLEAARELTGELEGLTEDEKALLAKDLDDIIADTPRTPVAATRWKKALAKVGQEAAHALREILIDIASETAKKTIWPHG